MEDEIEEISVYVTLCKTWIEYLSSGGRAHHENVWVVEFQTSPLRGRVSFINPYLYFSKNKRRRKKFIEYLFKPLWGRVTLENTRSGCGLTWFDFTSNRAMFDELDGTKNILYTEDPEEMEYILSHILPLTDYFSKHRIAGNRHHLEIIDEVDRWKNWLKNYGETNIK